MKISKKDVQLLIFLGVVSILAAYYWFIYVPQEAKLKTLQDQLSVSQVQREDITRKLSYEATLENNLIEAHDILLRASDRYYGNLYQEILVMTINSLVEGTELKVKGITFSAQSMPLQELMTSMQAALDSAKAAQNAQTGKVEPVTTAAGSSTTTETTPPATTPETTTPPPGTPALSEGENSDVTHVNTITASLQYEGKYADLEAFMYNVHKYTKHLVLQSVNVTSDIEGNLTGVIAIEFHGLPKIGDNDKSVQAYFSNVTMRSSVTDVFIPYETFIFPEVPEEVTPGPEEGTDPEFENEKDIVDSLPEYKLITSFENFDYFFTGNSPGIVGSASRTAMRTNGSYGLKLSYNFVEARAQNVANVVFDQVPIYVDRPGSALTMSVYTDKNVKNRLGAEIIDAMGRSFDMTFATEIQPTGWQELEALIPEGISYPFVVKRIFFEGTGLGQQLISDVIIDELKLKLPNIEGVQ